MTETHKKENNSKKILLKWKLKWKQKTHNMSNSNYY